MKKQFIAVEKAIYGMHYIVDNLEELICEMYECEISEHGIDKCTEWFFNNHTVFEVNGTAEECLYVPAPSL